MSLNRADLKSRAKKVLKNYYMLFFVASLVVSLLGGNSNYSSNGSGNSHKSTVSVNVSDISHQVNSSINEVSNYGYNAIDRTFIGRVVKSIVVAGVVAISLAIVLLAISFTFFIAFPIRVGGSKIYVETADSEHKPSLSQLGFAFKSGRYLNIVKAGFLTSLYSFLWSLLFIIPGVVKSYSYRMVPYILADNPDMDASSALRLSEAMTDGHKMEIFVMDLSFIGWYLLGSMFLGLGVLFVNPYKDATLAQMYIALRDNAIRTNIALPENFGLVSYTAPYGEGYVPFETKRNQGSPDDIVDCRDNSNGN